MSVSAIGILSICIIQAGKIRHVILLPLL